MEKAGNCKQNGHGGYSDFGGSMIFSAVLAWAALVRRAVMTEWKADGQNAGADDEELFTFRAAR